MPNYINPTCSTDFYNVTMCSPTIANQGVYTSTLNKQLKLQASSGHQNNLLLWSLMMLNKTNDRVVFWMLYLMTQHFSGQGQAKKLERGNCYKIIWMIKEQRGTSANFSKLRQNKIRQTENSSSTFKGKHLLTGKVSLPIMPNFLCFSCTLL